MGKHAVFAIVLLSLLWGCARPITAPIVESQNQSHSTAQWIFRHKVTVFLQRQGVQHSFDGVMRYDTAARTLHVIGLGAFGLPLFELFIGQTTWKTVALHPCLAAEPKIAEHIALSVRHMWLECSRLQSQQQCSGDTVHFCTISGPFLLGWPTHIRYKNTQFQYVVTARLLQAAMENEQ